MTPTRDDVDKLAEEYALSSKEVCPACGEGTVWVIEREAFKAGHRSRDPEVKRLEERIEKLEKVISLAEDVITHPALKAAFTNPSLNLRLRDFYSAIDAKRDDE